MLEVGEYYFKKVGRCVLVCVCWRFQIIQQHYCCSVIVTPPSVWGVLLMVLLLTCNHVSDFHPVFLRFLFQSVGNCCAVHSKSQLYCFWSLNIRRVLYAQAWSTSSLQHARWKCVQLVCDVQHVMFEVTVRVCSMYRLLWLVPDACSECGCTASSMTGMDNH